MFSRFATRYVGKVAPVAAPAPHVAVSQTDLRHPKNVANIVAGQSDEDEINSETVSQLLAQQSDTSEMMLPTGTSGTAGKGNKAGKGSKAGKGTASIAGGGFLKKGISSLTGGKGGKDGKGSVIPSDTLSPVGVTSAVDSSAVIDATTVSAAKGEVAVGAADAGDQGEAGVDPTDADVANTAAALKDAADQLKAANVALKRATDAGKDDDDSDTTDASDAGTATLTNKKAAATTTTTTAKATKDDAGASGKAAKGGAAAVTADKKAGAKAAAKVSKGLVVFEANKDGVVESFNTADAPGCKGAGKDCGLPGSTIHTLFTSNGSPYQNFQARIMVATWHLVRSSPGGGALVAMTRILHRTTPDELMDEVDTFRAQPLQPECDKWCWFPVADRANAVQQWLDAVGEEPSLQKAPWLLLLETDYVWVKPLQAPGSAYDPKVPGLSFAFDYIGPRNPVVASLLKDYCPSCDPASVPNSGPAPVLARYEDFKAATPMWEELSKWIETHEDAKKALGWVREMYAWDISVAANRLNILNQGPPTTPLISQPPHDHNLNNATMYHYTWGSIFKEGDQEIWKFDKRFYTDAKDALKVPKLPLPPPWKEDVFLHDGMRINKDVHATLTHMLVQMNAGIEILADLTDKAQPNA